MEWSEIRENKELYRERVEMRNEELSGFMGTSHVLPSRNEDDPDALEWFHRLMTECGALGVEYIQEGLHQNGEYLSTFFDSWEQVEEDFNRYKRESEEE